MLTSTLRQVGGSVMVAVPPSILDILDIKAGSTVNLSVETGRLVVEPRRRKKYSLADLVAKCDSAAPMSQEDNEWLSAPAVGKELL